MSNMYCAADYSDSSLTNLMNIKSKSWDENIASISGLKSSALNNTPEKLLMSPVKPSEIVG